MDTTLLVGCLNGRAGGLAEVFAFERAGVDDDVVTLAIAEGLGDGEAETGGFESEGQFGELSAALGHEFALAGAKERGWLGMGSDRLRARR